MIGSSPRCYIPSYLTIGLLVRDKKIFECFVPYIGMAATLVLWPGPREQTFVPPSHGCSTWNLTPNGLVVSEEKMFENVDRRQKTDYRLQTTTTETSHTTNKTCVREPPLRLTLNGGWCGKSCLSYKGTCHVILLAKLHDMYLYKTTTFPHQPLRSISKVAVLHRFYCISSPVSQRLRWSKKSTNSHIWQRRCRSASALAQSFVACFQTQRDYAEISTNRQGSDLHGCTDGFHLAKWPFSQYCRSQS